MTAGPTALTLELTPASRIDLIDVSALVRRECADLLERHRHALYCSYHTTAGYLEQSLCARLEHSREKLDAFVRAFHKLFPRNAPYRHDRLELRTELSEEQRRSEPKNADSHLTYIGSGLRSCVTYVNREPRPVYFIDLDGVGPAGARKRTTTVLGFDNATLLERRTMEVPVSGHQIDSVNLRDERLGVLEELRAEVRRLGITRGRIDISLAADESHAGLTVNEWETLLMEHDLVDVLRDPLRFAAERGRSMLRDPAAIPHKTLNYAKYDLVRVLNQLLDVLGISESLVERALARFLAMPASRFLRMKRAVSLLVDEGPDGAGRIVQGTYQSPILVQWKKADSGARRLEAAFTRFS